ncbi:transcriptional regulator, HxlR family [Chitinophaga sp. YR573]|uniref:winged helix-turn-helix transcriptional regulator n=1 Tax=Chitinophaga sp. YR573 TaxID=1881040 RepID=UPI0008C1C795|nr:helix-turn-helix domain-containing protein [Chitinophaga sp. YR573]SEV95224.1 transcriptional regulator, HxlR family [Chitinophaga sp. YR573]
MTMEENKGRQYICTIKNQQEIKYGQDALYVLSGKWRMSVVLALYNGLCRYREIAQSIPGITFAMLSKELQVMQLNNLILRIEDPDFPKNVEYRLTDYCESLYPIMESLINWGKQHRKVISS